MASFRSVMFYPKFVCTLFLCVLFLFSCKEKLNKSEVKQQIGDLKSLSYAEVLEWVVNTDIALVVDIAINRVAVIHEGKVWDSWNVSTGFLDAEGIDSSRTRLGIFTMHSLEYCPPWYPSEGEAKGPCDPKNLLGKYSLWFDRHVYGFHGRAETENAQSEFQNDIAGRRTSKGCVVNPHDKLEAFVDFVLQHPGFSQVPEQVERLKGYRDAGTKQSVKIDLEHNIDNPSKITVEQPGVAHGISSKIPVDIKLIVINSQDKDTAIKQSYDQAELELNHLFHHSIAGGNAADKKPSLDLIMSCKIHGTTRLPVFSDAQPSRERKIVRSLSAGDVVEGRWNKKTKMLQVSDGWVALEKSHCESKTYAFRSSSDIKQISTMSYQGHPATNPVSSAAIEQTASAEDATVQGQSSTVSWDTLRICDQSKSPHASSQRSVYDAQLSESDAYLSCLWHDPSSRGYCAKAYGCRTVVSHEATSCLQQAANLVVQRDQQRASGKSLVKLCSLRNASKGLCMHIPQLVARSELHAQDPCK